MAQRITPKKARQLLGKLGKGIDRATCKGMNKGLKLSLKYAVTRRMTGGGKRAPSLPDKLRIRSGDLRRTVRILKAKKVRGKHFVGGLKAGGKAPGGRFVIYARIHELGGIIRAKKAKYLRFMTPDGSWHMVKRVRIRPRPYLKPSLIATKGKIYDEVEKSIGELIERTI